MRKYDFISMDYFTENGLNDLDFIKDILVTSVSEFAITISNLEKMCDQAKFDDYELYEILHKFKPTAQIYKLSTFPVFKEYGAKQQFLKFEEFRKLAPEIIENLGNALIDIKHELSFIDN